MTAFADIKDQFNRHLRQKKNRQVPDSVGAGF
jgi:hypothetical protein